MRGKGRRRVARQPMAVVKQPTQTPVPGGEEEQFQDVVVGLIARYSRYSWITWLVVKIILKVTTYTVLKADKMDAEAHTWITDWGPFVNPVISLVVKPLYNLSSPLREQFGESAVDLAYRMYQQSVFFGTFTPDPDNPERSWASEQFSATWTAFLRLGAENSLAIPVVWVIWLVCLDFFRWKDRSKQRKILRSLSGDNHSEGKSTKEEIKAITDEKKAKKDNWESVMKRYKPRRGHQMPSPTSIPKVSIESSSDTCDPDAFCIWEFFKDMKTIWDCLTNKSKTTEIAKKGAQTETVKTKIKESILALPPPEVPSSVCSEFNGCIHAVKCEMREESVDKANVEEKKWTVDLEAGLCKHNSESDSSSSSTKDISKKDSDHCWSCKISDPKGLLRCRGCRKARYCSLECHAQDWKSHKKTCMKVSKKRPPSRQSSASEVD